MPRPILATISLSSLQHNLATVAERLKRDGVAANRNRPFVWAVIKANAYGPGLANAVAAFSAADGLALLDLHQAVRCRQAESGKRREGKDGVSKGRTVGAAGL